MPGGDGGDEELDAEGWKLKFLDLQVTYEELLESSHEYEQDLDNELKQYQLLEKQLREEVARTHHSATKNNAEEHSRKELDAQRIRQLETEIHAIQEGERRTRSVVRSLEQDNETLEMSQRVLQAELEDQGERLQDAIEELEFLRNQLEDYAAGVTVPVQLNNGVITNMSTGVSPSPPQPLPSSEETSKLPLVADASPRKSASEPSSGTVAAAPTSAVSTEGEAAKSEVNYEAMYKEERDRSKAILMTLAAAQSELFSLRSVVSGLTFRDGATMAIERGMGAKIDSWSRVRAAKEAAAKEAAERKGLEKVMSVRGGLGNGSSGSSSKNTNTNSARGVLLTRNNKLAEVWNPRYYVVDENLHLLECYMMATRTPSQAGASSQRYGSVNLQGADIVSYADDVYGRPHCFGITPHFSKQTTQLQASSAQEKTFWLTTLRALTTGSVTTANGNTLKEGHLDVEVQGVWNRCFVILTANSIKVFEKSLDRIALAVLDLSDGGEVSDQRRPAPLTHSEHGKKLTAIESEDLPLYNTTTSSSPSSIAQFSFAVRNRFIHIAFRASSDTERHLWVSSIADLLAPVGTALQTTPRQAPKTCAPVAIGVCFVNTRLVVYLEVEPTATVATLNEAVQNWMIHADQQKGRQNGPGSFLLESPWGTEQNSCFYCRQDFTWRNRRHGCRNCGQSVCASCSIHSAVVFLGRGKAGEEPQRVCDTCYSILIIGPPSNDIGLGPTFEPRIELISLSWHGEKLQEHLQLMDYGITLQSLLRVSFPEQADESRVAHTRNASSGRWKSLISSSSSHSRKGSEPSSGLPVAHPSLSVAKSEKKSRSGQNEHYDILWGEGNRGRASTFSRLISPPPRGNPPPPPSSHRTSPSSSSASSAPVSCSSPSSSPHASATATLSLGTTSSSIVNASGTTVHTPPAPPPLPGAHSGLALLDPLNPLLHTHESDHSGSVEQLLMSTNSKFEWKPRTLVLSHASKCLFYQSPALLKREATLKRSSRINPHLGDGKNGFMKPLVRESLESQTLGQISLANITHVTANESNHGKDYVFVVHANSRTWIYAAPTAQAQKEWVVALQAYCKPRA